MEFLTYSLIWGLTWGVIGLIIAERFSATPTFSFWISFFLGPIGLILVALSNRLPERSEASAASARTSFDGERDLASDGYRLWLAERYNIKRHDVFQRFVLGDKTFENLDDVLQYAHGIEEETALRAKEAEEKKLEEQQAAKAARAAALKEEEEKWRQNRPKRIAANVIVITLFLASAYAIGSWIEHAT